MTSSVPNLYNTKILNISGTRWDMTKRKTPFFFTFKDLSNSPIFQYLNCSFHRHFKQHFNLHFSVTLILCSTFCVSSATRHNIHMYPYFLFAAIHHLNSSPTFSVRPRTTFSQFVFCLVLQQRLSVKICLHLHFTLGQWSESWRRSVMSSLLFSCFVFFFSFSASFKNSSPWEKVGKLCLFRD